MKYTDTATLDGTADAIADVLEVDPETVMVDRRIGHVSLSHAQAARLVALARKAHRGEYAVGGIDPTT